MAKLEALNPGARITGIIPGQPVAIVDVQWRGQQTVELIYRTASGEPATQLLFRDDEERIQLVTAERTWTFETDAALFTLAAEAYRIHLSDLFEPCFAAQHLFVPLPHQIRDVCHNIVPEREVAQ